jgi:acetolactate synthase small subunit
LTSVEAFNSNEILSSELVLVRVSENNFGKRSSTAGVVNDFLHYSLDVPNSELALAKC